MISSPLKYSADFSEDHVDRARPRRASVRSWTSSSSYLRHWKTNESWDSFNDEYDLTHGTDKTAQNRVSHHVTRDSLVEGLLQSFNEIPQGSGPCPIQPPLQSSFRDGQLIELAPKKSLQRERPRRRDSYASTNSGLSSNLKDHGTRSVARSPPPGSSPLQTSHPLRCNPTSFQAHPQSTYTQVQHFYRPKPPLAQRASIAPSPGPQAPSPLSASSNTTHNNHDQTPLRRSRRGHRQDTKTQTSVDPALVIEKRGPELVQHAASDARSSLGDQENRLASSSNSVKPRQLGSNSFLHASRPKVTAPSPRTFTFTGVIRTMAGRAANAAEVRSVSPSYDLNPYDKSRRRSRSLHLGTSVLDRARPVPAEYHDFNENSREPRRKSASSHHPSSSAGRRPGSDKNQVNIASKSSSSHGHEGNSGDKREVASSRNASHEETTALPAVQDASKSQDASLTQASAANTRERPSFFRRVFSSSRHMNIIDPLPPQLPPVNTIWKEVDNDKRAQPPTAASQDITKTARATDIPPVPHEDQETSTRPVLHKKTSFFRRRKKTMNDRDVPMVVDTQKTDTNSEIMHQNPSASSLRKVADPSVNGPGHSPQDKYFDSLERQPESPSLRPKSDITGRVSDSGSPAPALTQVAAASADKHDSTSSRSISSKAATAATDHRVSQPQTNVRSKRDPYSLTDDDAVRSDARDREDFKPEQLALEVQPNKSNADAQTQQTRSSKGHWPKRSTSLTKKSRRAADTSTSGKQQEGEDGSSSQPLEDVSNAATLKSKPGRIRLGESEELIASARPTAAQSEQPADQVFASEQPSATSTPAMTRNITPIKGKEDIYDLSNTPAESSYNLGTAGRFSEQERAESIFNSGEDPATKERGAVALGGSDGSSECLRTAYMAMFDFSGLNILLALRDLCGRLAIKGETQQVDRLLASFSRRWVECNSSHGFKSADIVHTICYSLLLLNTDLHIADMDQKMTRTQFVRNTLPTKRIISKYDSSEYYKTKRPNRGSTRAPTPWQDPIRSPSPLSVQDTEVRPSLETRNSSSRLSVRQFHRPTSGVPSMSSPTPYDSRNMDVSEMLVNAPYEGNIKGWESVVEIILKDAYTSIRQLRLPLHGVSDTGVRDQSSTSSLSVVHSLMRRTGSITSRAESSDSVRGRQPVLSATASRWASKNRSRPKLYSGSTFGSSRTGSRTSLEESLWSPSASSTWSRPSFGPTQSTMSTESLASRYATVDPGYQQSIGFANALSHAIIREEGSIMPEASTESDIPRLDDEELELAGAPWAKEGILHHKHHLETTNKKFKDRTWYENFAVVEKGWMRLFSFHKSSSSLSRSHKPSKLGNGLLGSGKASAPIVGGGNWASSAEAVGAFMLRQTQAIVLPSPGYSKTRPYVFALTLPNGAIHLFSVGTEIISHEFTQTINYWTARLSKEPLVGRVSNVEYGWSENIINSALLSTGLSDSTRASIKESMPGAVTSRNQTPVTTNFPPSTAAAARGITHSPHSSQSISLSNRPSLQGSLRSRTSLDHTSIPGSSFRRPGTASLPADRMQLSEWLPPQQSLYASTLPEDEQLAALSRYVHSVDTDLAHHNDLRQAMLLAYTPRSGNSAKALANWERKSSHLLKEIVKFKTYVDALEFAAAERDRVKSGERGVRGMSISATSGDAREANAEDDDIPPVPLMTKGHTKGLSVSTTGDLDEGTLEALKITKHHLGRVRAGTDGSAQ